MDAEPLKRFLGKRVELRKRDLDFVLRGEISEIYLDSLLFLTDGRQRLILFSEILEVRELDRQTSLKPPTSDFYYQGNGREESWKR